VHPLFQRHFKKVIISFNLNFFPLSSEYSAQLSFLKQVRERERERVVYENTNQNSETIFVFVLIFGEGDTQHGVGSF
jgi:hypothetical protein